ncbi:SDR family NAD(P)-dependent oxidoreductase [Oceanobacillus halotolerans]|uniref:SDR family NAD(P)-dependent oxidoreductase n=1 Tax=Oceanobacillus halotolerans TaxID=2663380 RepID=UPI0013DA919A|nr:SDR family oxidoreductase [Oceanobacillus halotolerans]
MHKRRLEGKKIIITGASSGIGERLSWHIANQGGIPLMLARSIDKLEAQQELIHRELDVMGFIYQVDLQQKQGLEYVFHQLVEEHGQIDGLINNAGIGIFDYVKNMNLPDIEQMFQLNVYALMHGTVKLLPHFMTQKEAHIVNVASQAGKMATPKSAVYASTKHAVLGFTNALRLELVDYPIYVTAVNLGPVQTNFFTNADPSGKYQQNVARYMLDADTVARKVAAHLFTKKREINLPWWMEIGSKLYHLFPTGLERLLKKQFNKK